MGCNWLKKRGVKNGVGLKKRGVKKEWLKFLKILNFRAMVVRHSIDIIHIKIIKKYK